MIQRVLVPLDGSALAEQGLPQAVAVAKAFDAEILLLRVPEHAPEAVEGMVSALQSRMLCAEAKAYLKDVQRGLDAENVRSECVVASGRTAAQIVDYIQENHVDLVILSSHGQGGIGRFPLGGTVQKVVSSAGVSVMIVRAREEEDEPLSDPFSAPAYKRILVPLDGSQRAEWALGPASALASTQGAALILAHVVPLSETALAPGRDPARDRLSRELARLDQSAAGRYLEGVEDRLAHRGFPVRSIIASSTQVAETIQRVAEEEGCDLLVLTAHGHSGRNQCLYGGVAGRVIQQSSVPVLVCQDLIRPEGWEEFSSRASESRRAQPPLALV